MSEQVTLTAADVGSIDASIGTGQGESALSPEQIRLAAVHAEIAVNDAWRRVKHTIEAKIDAIADMPIVSVTPEGVSIHGLMTLARLEALVAILKEPRG
jgi:hypothetical protein